MNHIIHVDFRKKEVEEEIIVDPFIDVVNAIKHQKTQIGQHNVLNLLWEAVFKMQEMEDRMKPKPILTSDDDGSLF